MKKMTLLLVTILLLLPFLVVGCGIPQEQYDAVVAERDSAQAELQSVKTELTASQAKVSELTSNVETQVAELEATQAELEAANAELTGMKEVYPQRHFSSLKELQDWLLEDDVSERPQANSAEALYSKALDIQENALHDGYIVSVDLDWDADEELWYICCIAIINGEIWYWGPESDEPSNYSQQIDWQKVR